jgi:hypothetical protein
MVGLEPHQVKPTGTIDKKKYLPPLVRREAGWLPENRQPCLFERLI